MVGGVIGRDPSRYEKKGSSHRETPWYDWVGFDSDQYTCISETRQEGFSIIVLDEGSSTHFM